MLQPDEQVPPSGNTPSYDEATQALQPVDAQAARVVELLDHYLAQLKAGEKPDRAKLLAEHPELATQLEACLAGLEFIHGGNCGAQPSGKRLGDFRIVREIGHGGMGAVYEAEQISLGRRVALKVLRFGPVSDEEAITRFQREAETIARLHHTNIVPIFNVGSEHGVNYYAMQYIVGRSLDQVLRSSGKPIPASTVAEWGLQAAEALAHAHARGVIHRDVKPSNLLIDDEEGRIWLTDFGLAKRLDDVTLSMTGALLGTPRYMSPEQAMAAHHKLDHRTDLYSLGATLYELATNSPVFTGDSPHDVILKIIGRDVEPPRKHVPSLPRDLDTILMKCLAKEPSGRYSSSQQLADDLRAHLDNRPISARRTNVAELAVRWAKKQQRSLVLTVAAVAATLLLVAVAAASSYFWQRSRLAFVKLDTDRPPMVAEVLRPSGTTVTPRTTVPMQQAAEVPAGDYRLRVHSDQRFSQDYQISLSPGQYLNQKLDVENQLLWSDYKYPRTFVPIVIRARGSPGTPKTDLLLLNNDGIQRVDGVSRAVVCQLNLREPAHEVLKNKVNIAWDWHLVGASGGGGVGTHDTRPHVVSCREVPDQAVMDFNADGTSDLLVAARHQAWVVAVSGSDGVPLWVAARGNAVPLENGQSWNAAGILSGVPYMPLSVGDQDGDSIADFATWFMTTEHLTGNISRTLELLSGKTGATIWKYEAPAELFALPAGAEPSDDFKWYWGSGGGYGGGGAGGGSNETFTRRFRMQMSRHSGQVGYLPSALKIMEAKQVAFLAGSHLVRLDVKSGAATSPVDTTIRTTLAPRWADFDGDGATDVLFSRKLPDLPAIPGGKPTPQLELAVWSPTKRQKLWRLVVEATLPTQQDKGLELPVWPVVADLDGDGASEVLVPESSSLPQPPWSTAPWGTLAVLEGPTGKVRWRRQLRNVDEQLDTFAVGPDVDGDGRPDVFVASLWNEDFQLFLDCFSGVTGEPLWRNHHQTRVNVRTSEGQYLAPLVWYFGESDSLPRLIVRLYSNGWLPSYVGLYSSENGAQLHVAAGIHDAQIGDLDGNGVDDLLLARHNQPTYLDDGGTLHAVRGEGRERWRRLATSSWPQFDFNGDGVIDVVESQSGSYVARSGAKGTVLWKASPSVYSLVAGANAIGTTERQDFNRDGVSDILLIPGLSHSPYGEKQSIVLAMSGANGQVIWHAEAASHTALRASLLEARDLDADGEEEVICIAPLDYDLPGTTSLWLIVMSGGTGKTLFTQKLVARDSIQSWNEISSLFIEPGYADLNGDGIRDLIVPATNKDVHELPEMRALNGKDGSLLWTVPLPKDQHDVLRTVLPAVAEDLDGDGKPEVALGSVTQIPWGQYATQDAIRLLIVDGISGAVRGQHDMPVDRHTTRIESEVMVANRPRAVVIRRGEKEKWLGLIVYKTVYGLWMLDAQGKVVGQHEMKSQGSYLQQPYRLWTCDPNADGRDELVLFDQDTLRLVPPDKLDEPIWQSNEGWVYGAVQGVLRDAEGGPQLVVRGRDNDLSMYGLSAATGKKRWTCTAPNMVGDNWATLLRPSSAAQVPIAHYAWNNISLVRDGHLMSGAAPTPEKGKLVLSSVDQDPRLLRSLPWAITEGTATDWVWSFLWDMFYGILLVGLPVGFLVSVVRRRKWGLKTMLLLPVIVGLFLLGTMIHGYGGVHRVLLGKFVVAFSVGAPVLFSLYVLMQWIRQRKWRSVGSWLAVGLLLALIAVAVLLAGFFPKHEGPLEPGERWSWQGWYWVLPPSYFVAAWLMTLLLPSWWLGCFFWQRRRTARHKLAST